MPEAAQARLAEEAGRARPAGAVSILEERVKAGCPVLPLMAPPFGLASCRINASHIADVLQSLLSEPAPPRAAEPSGDVILQARRLAADEAEERFRGDLAALFHERAGDDHPWVRMALLGLRAAGSTVRDRAAQNRTAGARGRRARATPCANSLVGGNKSAAELEAFSNERPWYANAA